MEHFALPKFSIQVHGARCTCLSIGYHCARGDSFNRIATMACAKRRRCAKSKRMRRHDARRHIESRELEIRSNVSHFESLLCSLLTIRVCVCVWQQPLPLPPQFSCSHRFQLFATQMDELGKTSAAVAVPEGEKIQRQTRKPLQIELEFANKQNVRMNRNEETKGEETQYVLSRLFWLLGVRAAN